MKTLTITTSILFFASTTFSSEEFHSFERDLTLSISIVEINHPSCNGSSDGSVLVEVTGGEMPYEFDWNTFPAQTSAQATGLKKGIYFLQVKDAAGRISFQSIELKDPVQVQPKTASQSTCTNEMLTVEIQDNEFVYYLDGNRLTKPVITDLDIGIHKLTVTNQNNCEVSHFIQIVELTGTDQSEMVISEALIDTTALLSTTQVLVQTE
jgi:hypothetical protein